MYAPCRLVLRRLLLLPYHQLMNLARHSISSTAPVSIFDARFDPENRIFTTSTPAGFAIYRTWPLQLIRKRGMCPDRFAVSSAIC